MAEFLNKVSIQTATKNMRDFDLSCQHVTTQTFMRPSIAYAKEFFPSPDGTKIKMNLKTYSRMAPMKRPALGSIQIRNRAFFVPFRQVWSSFDAMLESVPIASPEGGSVILSSVPYFTYKTLFDLFTITSYGFVVAGSANVHDFAYGSGNNPTYVTLTADGRQALKILNQLGYQLPGFFDVGLNSVRFSFLPLLCASKVFLDWYFPAQYAHTGEFINVDGIMQRWLVYEASSQDVYSVLKVLQFVFYDNDYFTSQWDTPVSPAPGVFDSTVIVDITNNASANSGNSQQLVTNDGSLAPVPTGSTYKPTNGTPFVGSNVGSATANAQGVFTQFVDTALHKLTNAVKRHQLVGARIIDRMLADFGVVNSYESQKRSFYLGSQVFPVQISDVMSNSDTLSTSRDGAVLGDYAGKGLAYDGSGNFEYETKEFGMFLVFNSVVPDVGLVDGVDRQVLHKSRLDFYNPNYDGLGVMAVSQAELDIRSRGFDRVFGFLPQYSDYKSAFDRLSGDYKVLSRSGGLDSWLTLRDLLPYYIAHSSDLGSHQIDFMRGSDAFQFCRLFYGYTGEEFDCFYLVHRINLKVSMAASPMYDTYEFDEEEGQKITMQPNGAFLN